VSLLATLVIVCLQGRHGRSAGIPQAKPPAGPPVSLGIQHVPLELQFWLDRIPQARTAGCAQEPQQPYLVPANALVTCSTSGCLLAESAV
jgi:hypothetical protein